MPTPCIMRSLLSVLMTLSLVPGGIRMAEGREPVESELKSSNDEPTPAQRRVHAAKVLVIGHRGASRHAPENTMAAFDLALRADCDLIELDYYHSRDAIPVVFHDKDLDRTTNAELRFGRSKLTIGQLTWEELQDLDAGTWFHDSFRGQKVPRLDAAIERIQTGSVTLIERKQGDATTCVKLLRERGWTREVVVQAFDWEFLKECHRQAPELVLGALGSKQLDAAKLKAIGRTGATVIGWKGSDLTSETIEAAHEAGFRVWAYTINEPTEAERLVRWGIDGLITDDPAAMKRLVSGLSRK